MKKRKTYEVSVINKTYSKTYSDETKFYTSDTALELNFQLKEVEYDFDSAEIILLNVDDRSLVTRPVVKSAEGFTYELEDDITARFGEWKGQLKFNEGGEIYVSSPVSFRIENDLNNDRPPQLTDIRDWEILRQNAKDLIAEMDEAVTNEAARIEAENLRVEGYQEVRDFIDNFEIEENAVGTENIKDGAVGITKLGIKYDFIPSPLTFSRRDISTAGYADSPKRYASDFVILDDTQTEILNLSSDHQISPIFFDRNNKPALFTDWFDTSYDLKPILKSYPNAYKFAVKVRRKDDATMSENLSDFISSNVFVKTSKYPVNHNEISEINKKEWLKKFNVSNFDTSLLTSNHDGHLMLNSNISTTNFHKHLLYFDTDTQRKIKTVHADFVTSSGGESSNRVFLESSDGRTVWLSYSHLGRIEAFSLNKYTGTYTAIATQYGSNTLTYPTQDGVIINFKVVLVGYMAVVYIDDTPLCTFDLSSSVGQNINKAGISFRGNASNKSILKHFDVQYKGQPFMHISVDDIFTVLKDLTENQNNYASLFDHPDFKFFKEMHDTYGSVFSLYVYNRMHDDTFTISNVTTKYKQEFSDNANWLKFGYHSDWEDTKAVDLEDAYLVSNVESVYADISRFASYNSIDKIPRFGFFSANKSGLVALRDKGLILGALTADDERASNTGLSGVSLSVLKVADRLNVDGLSYFKTETRLDRVTQEDVISILNTLSDSKYNQESYILFSHSINQTAFRTAIKWANKRGIRFDYPVNNI